MESSSSAADIQTSKSDSNSVIRDFRETAATPLPAAATSPRLDSFTCVVTTPRSSLSSFIPLSQKQIQEESDRLSQLQNVGPPRLLPKDGRSKGILSPESQMKTIQKASSLSPAANQLSTSGNSKAASNSVGLKHQTQGLNHNENPNAKYGNRIWLSDRNAKCCYECETAFTIFLRRHHCRVSISW